MYQLPLPYTMTAQCKLLHLLFVIRPCVLQNRNCIRHCNFAVEKCRLATTWVDGPVASCFRFSGSFVIISKFNVDSTQPVKLQINVDDFLLNKSSHAQWINYELHCSARIPFVIGPFCANQTMLPHTHTILSQNLKLCRFWVQSVMINITTWSCLQQSVTSQQGRLSKMSKVMLDILDATSARRKENIRKAV